MRVRIPRHSLTPLAAALVPVAIAIQLFAAVPARADVISSSPTLPLLGAAYVTSGGAGCFPTKAICVAGGTLTLEAPDSITFNMQGEDILTDAAFSALITTPGGTPLGMVNLTGTAEQEVLGRSTDRQLGSWTVDLTGLSLSGPVLGNTLTVVLDGSPISSGTTSIVPVGDNNFQIHSFFDVFVDITLDSTPPVSTGRGPLEFSAIPEPLSLLVLTPAGLALLAARRRRATSWPGRG